MNTIFIGGSRHVSRLPREVKSRLDKVIASGHEVIIGDANGADKAVQKHFFDMQYDKVTVFCSGSAPRNNLGTWRTQCVDVPIDAKGFHFYAAKDRQMAREANFGLMIWDGKSPGTILNVLRLVLGGKIAVLYHVPENDIINIKTLENWKAFISQCSHELQKAIKDRATPEELRLLNGGEQPSFLEPDELSATEPSEYQITNRHLTENPVKSPSFDQSIADLNVALAQGNHIAVMNTLGRVARDRGMSKVARETGLARESLYRSLDVGGNPEFATVLKVLSSVGLRLEARLEPTVSDPETST